MKWTGNIYEGQKEQVWSMFNRANLPEFVRTNVRDYSQGNGIRAIFEIDFGFLEHVEKLDLVILKLSETVEVIKRVLGKEFKMTVSTN